MQMRSDEKALSMRHTKLSPAQSPSASHTDPATLPAVGFLHRPSSVHASCRQHLLYVFLHSYAPPHAK